VFFLAVFHNLDYRYRQAMHKVLLFQLEKQTFEVTIEAYFEKEELVIQGYDTGRIAEEEWGDSDSVNFCRITI
jgi:hypothetical protein